MLKFYSTLRIGNVNRATEILEEYLQTEVEDIAFPNVDNYLKSLVKKPV